jgi:hypothetical protein
MTDARWIGTSLLVAVTTTTATAQMTIPDAPTCSSCRITIGERTVRLRHGDEPIATGNSFVARTPKAYLVGGWDAPIAFDAEDTFLRALGRKGSGPREFQTSLAFATGPWDSVAVYDYASGRMTNFDPDLRFARSFRLLQGTMQGGMLWLSDGRFAMSGMGKTEETIQYTVHLYSPAGKYLTSLAPFGEPVRAYHTGEVEVTRLLHELPGGRLLTVTRLKPYEIAIWSLSTSRRLAAYHRDAPWFGQQPGSAISPLMVGIQIDPEGRLWTVAAAVAPNWQEGVRHRAGVDGPDMLEVVDSDKALDTVIEVLDLDRGQVLARRRLDRLYIGLFPAGTLAAKVDDEEVSAFDLFPVRLDK